MEPDGSPRPGLRQSGRSASSTTADDRVAAGGRVVGEEDQRLAVGRHLHRAEHDALAGQLAGHRAGQAGPASRAPTRLLTGLTVYAETQQRLDRGGVNQSSRGPEPYRSTVHRSAGGRPAPRRPLPPGAPADVARPAARRRRRSGGGPSPESVSVERLPEHRRHVDAAGHGDVRRTPTGARADLDHAARRHAAVAPADRRRGRRPAPRRARR